MRVAGNKIRRFFGNKQLVMTVFERKYIFDAEICKYCVADT